MAVGLGNLGPTMIASWICGEATTNYAYYNNANTYLGVGDSTTSYANSQTDLQASSNKTRKGMDSGYPSRSGSVITYRSTFATSDANYAWNEVGIFNAASGGQMLTRDVPAVSLGTKPNTQSWQLTVTLTLS